MMTEALLETVPSIPFSRRAEEAVLGAILISPEAFADVVHVLSAGEFYILRHQWIWKAFESLTFRREPIDMITIANELERNGKLAEIGGPAFLTALVNQVDFSFNADAYAREVHEYHKRRIGLKLAGEIAQSAYNFKSDFDPLEIWSKMVDEDKSGNNRKTGSDVLGEIYEDLYEPKFPLTFGVGELDGRLGGMFRTELTILAGDQGTGKSAMMLWMARKNAEQGIRTLGVSLEMKAKSWYMRMACGDLGVNWNQVRANKVPENIRLSVWNKAQELEEKYRDQFVIYEDPMTLANIQAAAMKERSDIIFIDHVGLISGQKEARSGVERIDQLNGITRFLRQNIAKPLNCHVVLLWQLNRSAFKENRRPTKHDLFMAGTQDPDSILLLYRPDLYQEEAQYEPPTRPVDLDVIIGKARNDFTGAVSLKYDLSRQSFHGLAKGL